MTNARIRTTVSSVAAGLLATTAIAFLPSLAATPASAGDDRPSCAKASPGGSSEKKCPSPSPSPSPSPTQSTPTGNETGCRDLTRGEGQFRGVDGFPTAGSSLQFTLYVGGNDTPQPATCPEVTYTVIARDMDTLAEVGRLSQPGNGVTSDLTAVIALPTYTKDCIAVDVIVADGDVVDDIGPNVRLDSLDLCLTGSGGQAWY
ncbi:MAG: hypothetical protein JJD92_16740 [Frankiaceae bacterium]|nr:hypothetical protein [Frankiaceae bacterium]